MAGLTALGFEIKRIPDIKGDLESRLVTQFGSDIKDDLARSESVLAQFVGILSELLAEVWEELENIYHSFDPDFAEGTSLEGLAALTGIERLDQLATSTNAILYGDNNTTVPDQSVASSGTDDYVLMGDTDISLSRVSHFQFHVNDVEALTAYSVTVGLTTYTYNSDYSPIATEILAGLRDLLLADGFAAVVIGAILSVNITDLESPLAVSLGAKLTLDLLGSPGFFQAVDAGDIVLPANSLTTIVSLVSGWHAVNNPNPGVTGHVIEDDVDFRLRRKETVSFPSKSMVESIEANLKELPGVVNAVVTDNKTDNTDLLGIPPHSIWAIVLGGADAEIAKVIQELIAGGIGMRGLHTENVLTDEGQEVEIKFDRPSVIPIYIIVSVNKKTTYPPDGDTLIKNAIVDYVAKNITIGDALYFSRLFTPINTVTGQEVILMFLGTAPSPSTTASLIALPNQLFTISPGNITITSV